MKYTPAFFSSHKIVTTPIRILTQRIFVQVLWFYNATLKRRETRNLLTWTALHLFDLQQFFE